MNPRSFGRPAAEGAPTRGSGDGLPFRAPTETSRSLGMRNDGDIKKDVEDELRWTPGIDPTDIAVSVKNGVVTLTGFTRSYMDKYEAERAAKRVAGVLGLANDIEVRL